MTKKLCKTCGKTKSSEEFSKNKRSVDGLGYYCKLCAKKKTKTWYIKNRDHVYEYNKNYRKLNPDKTKVWQEKYHRNWYLNNQRKKLDQNKHWFAENPGYIAKKRALRRSIRGAPVEKVDLAAIKKRDVTCYICSSRLDYSLVWPNEKSPTLDHIIPLSLGGGHVFNNLAYVHKVCNERKGRKVIEKND